MFWGKSKKKVPEPVDLNTGIALLKNQIGNAKLLLDNPPVKSVDHESWNNKTRECLIGIYGEGSPNLDTIIEASGEAPAWIFMPDDTAERYEAACLEDKMQKLEECVVALKRKADKA